MPAERPQDAHIFVHNLTMAYGSLVIQRDLTFSVQRGDIFIIMGGSGCGKSTLLRHLVGLQAPAQGDVLYDRQSLWQVEPAERERMMRRFGVLYQSAALQTQQLVQHVDKQLGQVASSATTTLGQVGKLTQTVHAQALALATSLHQTAAGALSAIEGIRETLTAAQQFVTPSAPVGYELVKTLREFSETARSLRLLANYLERHPNALVFGRQERGAK